MMARAARSGTLAWLVAVLAAAGCREPCERAWASAPVPSPDGTWLAEVRDESCSAGLGGTVETLVELRPATESSGVSVAVPSGQWSGGEHVLLSWRDDHTLQISVPNRTEFWKQLREYRGVWVEVSYRNDNPADRAAWSQWRKARAKWLESQGWRQGVPEPTLPPPPSPE
jgi:hypothetical protein